MAAISLTEAGSALMKRIDAEVKEHQRRLREDPEYRAEHERKQAEEHQRLEEAKRAEAEVRREAVERGREKKRIPERIWPFLDAYRARPVADLPASIAKAHGWIEKFLAGKPGWSILLLAGPVGTGKTTEACWFLDRPWTGQGQDRWTGEKTTVTHEGKGLFVSAPELAKASTFDADFWRECEEAPRLVIDDLGTERLDAPGQALANLSHLIARRHAWERPTVVTLNLTRPAFEARYCAHDGGRLRDRLAEAGWWVELTGPSQRRRLVLDEGEGQ